MSIFFDKKRKFNLWHGLVKWNLKFLIKIDFQAFLCPFFWQLQLLGGRCQFPEKSSLSYKKNLSLSCCFVLFRLFDRNSKISGVNFTNILHAAFPQAETNSKKRQSSQAAFALLGSVCVKAACKHVDEIDPISEISLFVLLW